MEFSRKVRTVRIDDIKIIDRIRKDYGNLDELAQDIEKWGLVNYPVVTPDNVLIAGERRIRACKMLGWTEIPVVEMTVRDYEHQLRLEISENENRKEFTISERLEYARRLEQIEKLKARERQAHGQTAPGKTLQENFPEALEKGQTRDKVAELVGFGSGKTYEKIKFVAEHGDPETLRRLDAGEISAHRAYLETKAKLEAAERAAREAEARAEAERHKAEELAARLAEAERALAEAKVGSAEAARLRTEAEGLRRELEELKARGPEVVERVVERVVEVPVERVIVRPDPAAEAELEKARAELEEERRRVAALEAMVAQLRKAQAAQKPSLKEGSEMRQLLERAAPLARELGNILDRLTKDHGSSLVSLARGAVPEAGDLRDAAGAAADSMAYTMFRLSLEFLTDRLASFFGVLDEKPPRLTVLKGGRLGGPEKA